MSAAAARDGAAGAIVLAGPLSGRGAGRAAFDPAWARVAGRPACAWPLDALDASPHIGPVALVVDAGHLARAERLIAAAGWRAVRAVAPMAPAEGDAAAPGLAAWLGAGLAALADRPDVVLLHEGARPQLPAPLLDALFAAWDGASAVGAASPVKETLKAVDARRRVRQTPPRDRLWQVHPPLLLPRPLLERILAASRTASERDPADTASLTALIARAPGVRLQLVPAGHEDVALRRRADVGLVEGMLAGVHTQ